jgi:hypothetical protein
MDKYDEHPKIVAATKDGKTEYWAVACPQEFAQDYVREALPRGWSATLTQRQLPIETARGLKMAQRDVQKLSPGTKFLP